MANNYGVFRSDNIKATKNGGIKSGRFYVSTTATAIENGNIVKLDSLITGERELWKVVAGGGVTTPNMYIVGTPEVIYDETLKSSGALNQFRNEAGENITLIPLEVGDEFSISDACITPINDDDDIPAVGSYVSVAASGTKWVELASIAQNEVFYGKIIRRELYKKDTYLNVIEMISVR
jgi:hypothetical protein